MCEHVAMCVCLWPPRLTPSTSLHHQLSPLIYIVSPPTNGISHKFPEVRQNTHTQAQTYRHKCVYCMCVYVQDILVVMCMCVCVLGWAAKVSQKTKRNN